MSNEKFTVNERMERVDRADEWATKYRQRLLTGMNKPILFHGTNKRDYGYLMRECGETPWKILPARWWTTHLGKAINDSFESALRPCSKMIIYAVPAYTGDASVFNTETYRTNICCNVDSGCFGIRDVHRTHIKAYFQSDLDKLIDKHCLFGTRETEKSDLRNYIRRLKEKARAQQS